MSKICLFILKGLLYLPLGQDRELKDDECALSYFGLDADSVSVWLERGAPLSNTQTIFRVLLHNDETAAQPAGATCQSNP